MFRKFSIIAALSVAMPAMALAGRAEGRQYEMKRLQLGGRTGTILVRVQPRPETVQAPATVRALEGQETRPRYELKQRWVAGRARTVLVRTN